MVLRDTFENLDVLKNHGANHVFTISAPEMATYNISLYTDAFCHAIESFSPDVVLGIASPMGRDLFPRVCMR